MATCQWCEGSGTCPTCGGSGLAEAETAPPEADTPVLTEDDATQIAHYEQERQAFLEALKPKSRRAKIGVALGAVLAVAGGLGFSFGLIGNSDDGPLHPVDAYNATFPTGQDAIRSTETTASSAPTTTTTTIPWEPQTALVKDETYRVTPIEAPQVFADLPEANRPAPLGTHWVRVRLKVESLVEDRRTQPPLKHRFGLTFPETEECGASLLSGGNTDSYERTNFDGRCTTNAFNGERFWEGFHDGDFGLMFPPLSSGVLVLAGLFDDDQFPDNVGVGYRSGEQTFQFMYPGSVPGAPESE